MNKTNTIDFTRGNLFKNLLAMYIPLYLAYFCTTLYSIIGGLWVGNLLGQNAFAAQSASVPLYMLYSAIVMGATNGVTIVLSKYLGAKEEEKISATLVASFIALFLFGDALTVLCLCGINGILAATNTPREIFSQARSYLFFTILSFPFIELYLYLSAVLRSYGNTSLQMITIIITTLLNVILDPILIFRFGLDGAAIATLLAQIISVVIMIFYISAKKMFRFDFGAMNGQNLKEITRACIPSAIQQAIPTVSTAVIQALFSGFGVVALAAYGVASKLEVVVLYPALTINMSVTTAVGTCSGAGSSDKIRKYFKLGVLQSVCLDFILTLAVLIFSRNLAGLFGVTAAAKEMVSSYFSIIAVGYVVNCVTLAYIGELNGLQMQVKSMILMAVYYIAIRLPLAKALAATPLKINGIMVSIAVSFLVPAIASVFLEREITAGKIRSAVQREAVAAEEC